MFKEYKKIACLLILLLLFPNIAKGATLKFHPSSGVYNVGEIFKVDIGVSSLEENMNAVSGIVNFPQNKVEVENISKKNTIIDVWVKNPSFSNREGNISFEGAVLNPGYFGPFGKILTVKFKVKAAGSSFLDFVSGSVLANDGKGTDILSELEDASFSFGLDTEAPGSETPSSVGGTPIAPEVFYSTHTNPNKWYSKENIKINWKLSPDTEGVRLLLNKKSYSTPSVHYAPPIKEKEIEEVEDGVWYFHIQLKNKIGWGSISHFKIQIDTNKPRELEIKKIKREDLTNPRVQFKINAADEMSGIEHYEMQVDNKKSFIWRNKEDNIFTTKALEPGEHTLIVKAVDKAGNYLMNLKRFNVEPIAPPIINDYSPLITKGDILLVKGQTFPHSKVIVWLQKENELPQSHLVESDRGGTFNFIADGELKSGIYKLWTEVVDDRGAKSEPTKKITIAVQQPPIIKIGTQAITALAVIIPLIALVLILIFIIYFIYKKVKKSRKKIEKETNEASEILQTTIKNLKNKIEAHFKKINNKKTKKELIKQEKKFNKKLQKEIKNLKNKIGKEIEDITEKD